MTLENNVLVHILDRRAWTSPPKNPCALCVCNAVKQHLCSKISNWRHEVSIFPTPSQTGINRPSPLLNTTCWWKQSASPFGRPTPKNGALSLTIGPSRCLALCWGNRAAQQHIGGSEEASDAPGHVPRPPSPHNLACSVPTQWQTHLRWQRWWTLSSVLVTNAEIIRSDPRKRLIMMHCYCCSHPRYYIAWSPVILIFWVVKGFFDMLYSVMAISCRVLPCLLGLTWSFYMPNIMQKK